MFHVNSLPNLKFHENAGYTIVSSVSWSHQCTNLAICTSGGDVKVLLMINIFVNLMI